MAQMKAAKAEYMTAQKALGAAKKALAKDEELKPLQQAMNEARKAMDTAVKEKIGTLPGGAEAQANSDAVNKEKRDLAKQMAKAKKEGGDTAALAEQLNALGPKAGEAGKALGAIKKQAMADEAIKGLVDAYNTARKTYDDALLAKITAAGGEGAAAAAKIAELDAKLKELKDLQKAAGKKGKKKKGAE